MPYVEKIVSYINSQLKSNSLKGGLFSNSSFNTLADLVPRQGDKGLLPAYIDNEGNGNDVTFDDRYNFQCYHRFKNPGAMTLKPDIPRNQFGNDIFRYVETANMLFVGMGDRDKLNMRPEELFSLISASFPSRILPATIKLPDLYFVMARIVGNSLDQFKNWRSEMKLNKDDLKPNQIMILIDYTIETRYDKRCLNNCNCNSGNLDQENGDALLQENGNTILA